MLQNDRFKQLNSNLEAFIREYENYSVSQLCDEFGVNNKAKNKLNVLANRMLSNSKVDILDSGPDGEKLCVKTIKLDKYGRLKESMSFPVFKYIDLSNEEWEQSSLRNIFIDNVFVFIVFKDIETDLQLQQIRIWKMPLDVLDGEVYEAWKRTQNCVRNGMIVKYIDGNGRSFSYFPTSADNRFVHVRPHAANKNDTLPLPVPDKLTGVVNYPKHSFWLNRFYVLRILSGRDE